MRRLVRILVVMTVLAATGWGYWYRGKWLSERAWDAYYVGDPEGALARYQAIARQYPSFCGDFAEHARHKVSRLADYLHAVELRDTGQVDEAIAAYESFCDRRSGCDLYLSLAREALTGLKLKKAGDLQAGGEYSEAIEAYRSLLALETVGYVPRGPEDKWGTACQGADVAIEEGHEQARSAIPSILLQWFRALDQRGDYEECVKGYKAILREHPNVLDGGQGEAALSEAYCKWAAHLRDGGDYQGAIEKYRSALKEYPDGPDREEAEAAVAEVYGKWAAQLREAGDYEGAIGKYRIVLQEYPDTPTGARAEKAIAETHQELAAWRERTLAVPKMDSPKEVTRDSEGRWAWTTMFRETGGEIGYTLSGKGWIVDSKGRRWGPLGTTISRGSVTVPAGGKSEDSYWCRGDKFGNGHGVFTWSGEDANGHPIMIEEKVRLLASEPSPEATSSLPPPTATVAPTTYIVQRGDTLASIAAKYGVTVDAIVEANDEIKDTNVIEVGQVLVIPSAGTDDG